MKVLVTGGAGFIGSHVVDQLLKQNHQVTIVDNLATGKKENINQSAIFYSIDIRDKELEKVFQEQQPEVVIHMAAQSSVPPSIKDPLFDQSVNIGGLINILELMKKYKSKKIIYSSSAAIYGNPIELPISIKHPIQPVSPYGLSKFVAENYIELYERMYGIDYTILRYANIYGPRQIAEGEGGVIAIFTEKMMRNEALTINGDGRHTRDFVYVKDVAAANVTAIEKGSKSIVNISSGNAVTLIELVKLLEAASNQTIQLHFGPEREGDIVHSTLDPVDAWNALGWKATTPLLDGLEQTFQSKLNA